jgi:SAM-dependent methyltransferase
MIVGDAVAAQRPGLLIAAQERRARLALAALERIAAVEDYPLPPERGVVMATPQFRDIGMEFLWHFVAEGGLEPDHNVLDIGCGGGRMAAALLYYLDGGSYRGFDIHPESIAWCERSIAVRDGRFHFEHVDVDNPAYHSSTNSALELAFPVADGSIDFAIATSLFTHMFSEEVGHYLAQAARVLRPGGVLFATAFLLTPASLVEAERTGGYVVSFPHEHRGSLISDRQRPEGAVAHFAEPFNALVAAAGLFPERHLAGSWCGQRGAVNLQDIVVLRKPAAQSV